MFGFFLKRLKPQFVMYSLSQIFLAIAILTGASFGDEILDIPIKKAPYKVLIIESQNYSQVLGAGAILSQHWAITTAACIMAHRGNPTTLMVRSGSGIYNTNGGLHYVKKIIVHPDFRGQDKPYMASQGDVALLRLILTFHLSLTVAPVPVPPQVTPAGTTAHLISWPLTDGKRSNTLKALTVSITDWVECRKAFQQAGVTLSETTVCTTSVNNFQAQEGDPLVTSGTLTGLYKTLISTADQKMLPQCYVDIASFMAWIEKNIKE